MQMISSMLRRGLIALAAAWTSTALLALAATAQTAGVPVTECDRLAGNPDDPQGAPGAPGFFEIRRIDVAAARNACSSAISGHPDVPRFKFQLARALIADTVNVNNMDCRPALDLLQAAIGQGHAESALLLGRCHGAGFGLPRDSRKARVLIEKSYELGSPSAKARLARGLIGSAQPFSRDVKTGMAILEEIAETGNTTALAELAELHAFGYWIERNHLRAYPYLVKAADRRHLSSEYRLGKYLVEGIRGAPQDPERGLVYIRRAAAAGHPSATQLQRKLEASLPAEKPEGLLPHGKLAK